MRVKTNELTGAPLDWAVAKCEGIELTNGCYNRLLVDGRMSRGQEMLAPYNPSTDWAQGGPIIEREKTAIKENGYGHWFAKVGAGKWMRGPTPLIAAMRCYVASKLGKIIDISEELYND